MSVQLVKSARAGHFRLPSIEVRQHAKTHLLIQFNYLKLEPGSKGARQCVRVLPGGGARQFSLSFPTYIIAEITRRIYRARGQSTLREQRESQNGYTLE